MRLPWCYVNTRLQTAVTIEYIKLDYLSQDVCLCNMNYTVYCWHYLWRSFPGCRRGGGNFGKHSLSHLSLFLSIFSGLLFPCVCLYFMWFCRLKNSAGILPVMLSCDDYCYKRTMLRVKAQILPAKEFVPAGVCEIGVYVSKCLWKRRGRFW